MKGGASAAWVGLGLLLAACPGTDAPGLDDGFPFGTGSSTGERPGITTFNSTVDPTLPGDGEGTTGESTTAMADGTTAGSTAGLTDASATTNPGTSTDVTTDPTDPSATTEPIDPSTTDPVDPSTTDPVDPSTTDPTNGGGCNEVPGNYAYCLNMGGGIDTGPCAAPGDATCLYTGELANPVAAVCSVEGCVDACDCPAAPASGDAVVTCDDVTGDPANLLCYLDCGGGQDCPNGMTCFAGFLCMWPGPGAAGDPYGDCFTDPAACGLEGICLSNGAMPTIGVCTTDCNVLGDCPASPGGTAPVSCEDVTGDGFSECILDCSTGGSCPAGMTCFSNFLCAWN